MGPERYDCLAKASAADGVNAAGLAFDGRRCDWVGVVEGSYVGSKNVEPLPDSAAPASEGKVWVGALEGEIVGAIIAYVLCLGDDETAV